MRRVVNGAGRQLPSGLGLDGRGGFVASRAANGIGWHVSGRQSWP